MMYVAIQSGNRRRSRRGFTLIELLVVIAIICLLLSILLPALGYAKVIARRTVCQATLSYSAKGIHSYAVDHKTKCPPASANFSVGLGSYATWQGGYANDPYKGYKGVGILAWKNYLEPRGLYCPSWDYASVIHVGHTMALNYDWGWHEGEDDHRIDGQKYIWTSYHYRGSTGKVVRNNLDGTWRNAYENPMMLSKDSESDVVYLDHFSDPYRNIDAHHQTGYNCATLDGSAHWVDDTEHWVLEYLGATEEGGQWIGGQTIHAGSAGYVRQEFVFKNFFEAQISGN